MKNNLRKQKKMSLKSTLTIASLLKRLLIFSMLFLSVLLFFATTETLLNTFLNNRTRTATTTTTTTPKTYPKWFEPISKPFHNRTSKQLKIALVNLDGETLEGLDSLHKVNITHVNFERISPNVTWRKLYPIWIDEKEKYRKLECPKIPMPNNNKYKEVDIVVAKIPCGNWSQSQRVGIRDVYRLQVSLVAATLAVESGNKEVSVVFVGGECEPMLEMFKCDDLVWHEAQYWVYKPDLNRLKQKISLPVGGCEVAKQPFFFEPDLQVQRIAQSITSRTSQGNTNLKREAYVTLLHSSELYVCGAIALAQSIRQTNTTKDLIILIDNTISPTSIEGLKSAGWRIKRIERVRCPSAKKGHYNEWNCSKLRIWQLTDYDKVIFIDADFIVLKNIDHFFNYPQLSASEDTMSIFNSGVMIAEPSNCFFNDLMAKRYTLHSYNGGDQGLLNEVFTWWHRITMKISFLKCFMGKTGPREVPNDVYMIHFVGVKPWACYRDYDCNWDQIDRHIFASDQVHAKWWQVYDTLPSKLKPYCGLSPAMDANIQKWKEIAKNNVNFTDTHWKIDAKDPRRNNLTNRL